MNELSKNNCDDKAVLRYLKKSVHSKNMAHGRRAELYRLFEKSLLKFAKGKGVFYNVNELMFSMLKTKGKYPSFWYNKTFYIPFMFRNPKLFISVPDSFEECVEIDKDIPEESILQYYRFERAFTTLIAQVPPKIYHSAEQAIGACKTKPVFHDNVDFHAILVKRKKEYFNSKFMEPIKIVGKLNITEDSFIGDKFTSLKDKFFEYGIVRYTKADQNIKKGNYIFYGLYYHKRIILKRLVNI